MAYFLNMVFLMRCVSTPATICSQNWGLPVYFFHISAFSHLGPQCILLKIYPTGSDKDAKAVISTYDRQSYETFLRTSGKR